MLKIRLRRVGKKRHPYYRLVVANNPDKRDGAFLETLGSYDPHQDPPLVTLDEAKTREWLGKGALPSEAAAKILTRAGISTPAGVAAAIRPARPAAVVEAPATAAPKRAAPPKAAAPAAEPPAVAEAPEAEPEEPAAEPVASAPEAEPDVPETEPAAAEAEPAASAEED